MLKILSKKKNFFELFLQTFFYYVILMPQICLSAFQTFSPIFLIFPLFDIIETADRRLRSKFCKNLNRFFFSLCFGKFGQKPRKFPKNGFVGALSARFYAKLRLLVFKIFNPQRRGKNWKFQKFKKCVILSKKKLKTF